MSEPSSRCMGGRGFHALFPLPPGFYKEDKMRIFGKSGHGENTCKPRKEWGKKTKAEKRLAKRIASYDMIPLNLRKRYRRPGSLKQG